jgi:hypothetical protein
MGGKSRKSTLRRGFKKWAEEQAIYFRRQLGLKPTEPLKAYDLTDYLGIEILVPSGIKGLSSEDLNTLMPPANSFWSAVIVQKPLGGHFIIYNNSHAPPRRESDLMHELAHFICKHESSSIEFHPQLGFPLRKHHQEQEEEAECLGSCLQLPAVALEWALRQGMGVNDIATYYTASVSMARYRINITGLAKRYKVFA